MKKDINRVESFVIGKRIEDQGLNNWQAIDLKSSGLIIDKPCVLVFGGNGTKDERAANGNAKFVSNLIGKINEPVDVFSIAYVGSDWREEKTNARCCEEIAKKLFLPLLVDQNGERISLSLAKKNMRRINVFTHCVGYNRFNLVLENLRSQMFNLNYSEQEINDILSKIFEVDYAPLDTNVEKYNKQVLFQSASDEVLGDIAKLLYWHQKRLIEKGVDFKIEQNEAKLQVGETFEQFQKKFNKWVLSNPQYLIGVATANDLFYFASGFTEAEDGDHAFNTITRNARFEMLEYINSNGQIVSVLIADLLINAISNSIENENSKRFKKLASMGEIEDVCNSIVKRMLYALSSNNEIEI